MVWFRGVFFRVIFFSVLWVCGLRGFCVFQVGGFGLLLSGFLWPFFFFFLVGGCTKEETNDNDALEN